MPDDRFEDRLRAFARQLSRSLSETDLDDVADRFGVDPDRVRGAASAMEGWLNDRAAEPLFDGTPAATPAGATGSAPEGTGRAAAVGRGGPHPLDLPTDAQGRALSALASGRWTLRPGSGQLAAADVAPVHHPAGGAAAPPQDGDVPGELRARDWITADGTVTLIGRQALLRWARAADAGFEAAEPGS